MNDRTPRRSGFTLIETVVAIAIAGVAFFMLTETFFNVLLTLESLKSESDYQNDVRFARSQIIQISDRDELEEGGEITTLDLGTATWRVEIEETGVIDLFKLILDIEFENPDGDRIPYTEQLFLLRPTWGDSFERGSLLSDVRKDIEEKDRRRDW